MHQSPLSECRLALTVRSNMYVPLHRRQVFIRLHRTDPSAVSDPPSPAAVALRNGIVAALEAARQVPIDLVDESDYIAPQPQREDIGTVIAPGPDVAETEAAAAAAASARGGDSPSESESDEDMPVNPDTALPWPAAAVSGTVYLCVMCVAIVPVLRSY